jgi:hypothetical protein
MLWLLFQVWLPDRASRLIIATESIWKAFDTCYKAAAMLRGLSLDTAASALVHKAAAKRGSVREDLTALVAELKPQGMNSFKDQVGCWKRTGVGGRSGRGGGLEAGGVGFGSGQGGV